MLVLVACCWRLSWTQIMFLCLVYLRTFRTARLIFLLAVWLPGAAVAENGFPPAGAPPDALHKY